jgi:hypothetical protein
MERLRKKDASDGVASRPLTDAQKVEIADVRRVYEAKLAQEDVMHQSKMRALVDPAERETVDDQYRRIRERTAGERDRKIEQIRERKEEA